MAMEVTRVLDTLRQHRNYDFLGVNEHKSLRKCFLSNSGEVETVHFSSTVTKINRKEKRQKRDLIVTNRALYNFKPRSYGRVRRRMRLRDISAFVLSRVSDELVVKMKDSYDYRLEMRRRAELVEVVSHWFEHQTAQELACVMVDEGELRGYCTTRLELHSPCLLPTLEELDSDDDFGLNERQRGQSMPCHPVARTILPVKRISESGEFGSPQQQRSSQSSTNSSPRLSALRHTTMPVTPQSGFARTRDNSGSNDDCSDEDVLRHRAIAKAFLGDNTLATWLTKLDKRGQWKLIWAALKPRQLGAELQLLTPRIKGAFSTFAISLRHTVREYADEQKYAFALRIPERRRPLVVAAESAEHQRAWLEVFQEASLPLRMRKHAGRCAYVAGWLLKRDPTRKTWRRRFFAVRRDHCWFFEFSLRNSFPLNEGAAAHRLDVGDKGTLQRTQNIALRWDSNFAHRFNVSDANRVYSFAADVSKEAQLWIEAVTRVGRGQHGALTNPISISDGIDDADAEQLFLAARREQAPEGVVALVFTDVQSSTSLWESVSDAMGEALELHDDLMRLCMRQHHGYEVKTEGDAFMVAFFSVTDALLWCVDVQHRLLSLDWPLELLTHAAAAESHASAQNTGDDYRGGPFRGLRVRMGVHVGRPNARRNPVTGRMDYFGSDVNLAARVADAAHGGQVVCSRAAYRAVVNARGASVPVSPPSPPSDGEEPRFSVSDLTVYDLGEYDLKGISGSTPIYDVRASFMKRRELAPLRAPSSDDTSQALSKLQHIPIRRLDANPALPIACAGGCNTCSGGSPHSSVGEGTPLSPPPPRERTVRVTTRLKLHRRSISLPPPPPRIPPPPVAGGTPS
ncbi:MAG: hypothetical protein MHM6MM_001207 [Cercozoa sp. M6MM]